MSGKATRLVLYAGLVVAFALHNDLWLWDDPRTIGGIPVGLAYHLGFCLAVSVWLGLLVTLAWPADLESREPQR